MKELLIICILLVLATALGVYLITWAAWRNIDIISSSTADYIRTVYDSDFDAEIFRIRVRSILRELHFLGDNSVIFHTPFYERRKSRRTLNAHTGFPGQGFILLTLGWVVRLHREFDRSASRPERGTMTDLLIYVLAHEMVHKEGQLSPVFVFGKKRICLGWIREIDADIGAIKKSGMPVERVIACIRAEILKKKAGYGDGRLCEGRRAHPTWEYRIACMKEGTLSNAMIDKICRDCGVTDRRFCERVKKYYGKRPRRAV